MSVTLDDLAFDDLRFLLLAEKMGLEDPDTATMKMARVWRYCTKRGLKHLTPIEIALAMRQPASRAGDLAGFLLDVDLAAKTDSELLYIRGTNGRTEWLEDRKNTQPKAARLGGESRANSAQRDASGRFLPSQSQPPGPGENPGTPAAYLLTIPTNKETAGSLESSPSPKAKKASKGKKAHPDRRAITDVFQEVYVGAYGCKPKWDYRELAIADKLAPFGAEEVRKRASRLFAGSLTFLSPPYDIATLDSNWNRLVAPAPAKREPSHRRMQDFGGAA